MTDILERLRDRLSPPGTRIDNLRPDLIDAIDEIGRLRAALNKASPERFVG